jgi:2-polyprenyl-6-methoxyphenol hydroxylase-like FAD-dependent oxidoreductase
VTDVLVVGGGPAGCAAATLLARWGHEVTLVTKPAADTLPLGESIPPSTRKLFDVLGVRPRIAAAGFIRASGNTVWWGSHTPRVEYFADNERGWQVTNTQLASLLRDAAVDAGARTEIDRVSPDDERVRRAAFVLDCSGRAGVIARARQLRTPDTTRTIAMVGLWQSAAFRLDEPSHTAIQSYDGGWAWSVPHAERDEAAITRRFVAVMIDPRTSDLARSTPSTDVYLGEIRKAPAIEHMLETATLVDGPRGWDASMYHATRYADGNILLVGDAGSFIDPLSSAGVKKALASGWLAAVATHTSMIRPHMRRIALDFFDAREREIYTAFRAMTDEYWRDAALGHAHPFWADRIGFAEAPADRDAVRAAFEQIRQAPALRIGLSADVQVQEGPAVSGSEIVLERRLSRPGDAVGIRYVHDVDLVTLAELAPVHRSVPALFEAYNRVSAPVSLPDFLAGLATAMAQQWLRWCDTY